MANIHEHVDYVFDEIVSFVGKDIKGKERQAMKPSPPADLEQLDLFKSLSKANRKSVLPGVFFGEFYSDKYRYLIINLSEETYVSDQIGGAFGDICWETPSEAERLFCAKQFCLKVDRLHSKSLIEDQLLYQHQDDNYSGHDLNEIFEYFEPFSLCKVSSDHILYNKEIDSLAYLITMSFEKLIPLPLNYTLNQYSEILSHDALRPLENVFLSLTSTHWKHAFLELYRCFEGLYVVPAALCLKNSIGYKGKAIELAEKCIDTLDWRRKEESSLCKLLKDCLESEAFEEQLSKTQYFKECEHLSPEKIASKLYKLRNVNVHQAKEVTNLQDEEWLQLISLMLIGIEHLYDRYRDNL